MTRYRRRGEFEAVQWTCENFRHFTGALGPKYEVNRIVYNGASRIHVSGLGVDFVVWPGQWMLVGGGVDPFVVGNEDFEIQYEPVAPLAADELLAAAKEAREWHKQEYRSNTAIEVRLDAAIAAYEQSKT